MAALILGGPEAATGWIAARPNPPIRLKVVNFASSSPSGGNVDATYLSEAIGYLVKHDARVINMSLANGQNLSGLTQAIAAAPDVLFVVAAGNAKLGRGRNLDIPPLVFPARYGGRIGDHRRHVVTVGAADLSGKRAIFSHFSEQYVDFLASGCAVETRDDLGNTVFDNGTSPATAITTFASSLIASLGIKDANAIKNRLLISTDFDLGLKDASWSSGRLDIVKAISLRNDVIQLTSSKYLFAKLNKNNLKMYCDDQTKRASLSLLNLRKIIPNIPASQGQEIEFWTEADGILERTPCPQANIPGDDSIGLIGGNPGPSLADIKDITFAAF
jgi:hypothetical protein